MWSDEETGAFLHSFPKHNGNTPEDMDGGHHGDSDHRRSREDNHKFRRRSERPNCQNTPFFTLFVDGLADSTSENELEFLFSAAGPVFRTFISHYGKRRRDGKTYGFVTYEKAQHAKQAIHELNGEQYKGCSLRVTWSKKPLNVEDLMSQKAKSSTRGKRDQFVMKDEEKYLYNLTETYTMLKSQETEGEYQLPELAQFLIDIRRQPLGLTPSFTDDDYQLIVSLADIEKSFIHNLEADTCYAILPLESGNVSQSTVSHEEDIPPTESAHSHVSDSSSGGDSPRSVQQWRLELLKGENSNEKWSLPSYGRGRGAIMAALGLSPGVGHGNT